MKTITPEQIAKVKQFIYCCSYPGAVRDVLSAIIILDTLPEAKTELQENQESGTLKTTKGKK